LFIRWKIGRYRSHEAKLPKTSADIAVGIVERTFGWLGRSRRLSRDYERRAQVAEAFVYLAMCRLMLHRWIKN